MPTFEKLTEKMKACAQHAWIKKSVCEMDILVQMVQKIEDLENIHRLTALL